MVKMWGFLFLFFFWYFSNFLENQRKEFPSFLNDKEERVFLLLLCLQMCHIHHICVQNLNEPASVQSRFKCSLPA